MKIIFFGVFLLLSFAQQQEYNPFKREKLPSPSNEPIINGYLFGNKSKIDRSIQRIHADLGLSHLMTPSGLHLTFLLGLLLLLRKFFSIKKESLIFIALTALFFITFPYGHISSFKRMILYGVLRTNPIAPLKNRASYIFTFILCFILGQYQANPFSFTLSFIFLGVILFAPNNLVRFSFILLAQWIISDWFNKPFYLLGSFYGLLLTAISPLLFILLIGQFLLEPLLSIDVTSVWVNLLKIIWVVKGIEVPFTYELLIPCLFFGLSFGIRESKKKAIHKYSLLGLSILFWTTPLNQSKAKVTFSTPPPKDFTSIKDLKSGARLNYDNGMKCYASLRSDQWSYRCRK